MISNISFENTDVIKVVKNLNLNFKAIVKKDVLLSRLKKFTKLVYMSNVSIFNKEFSIYENPYDNIENIIKNTLFSINPLLSLNGLERFKNISKWINSFKTEEHIIKVFNNLNVGCSISSISNMIKTNIEMIIDGDMLELNLLYILDKIHTDDREFYESLYIISKKMNFDNYQGRNDIFGMYDIDY